MGMPQFTPSGGVGSKYTDPKTGNQFEFKGGTNWEQISSGAGGQQQQTTTTTRQTTDSKQYGGWYDNPSAGGKNQRYWGTDASGNPIWTDGDEPNAPKSAEEVTPFLNNYQNKLLGKSIQEVKDELTPNTNRPDLLNREQKFQDLRAEYNVADLETQLNDLKAQEDDEVAFFRQQRFDERGKPVATNVISGRISKEEQQANERLDYIGRQKSRIVDELNTKYSIIGQIMQFASLDYQDAVSAYESEFNENLGIYKLLSDEQNQAQQMASANLQIYMNAITKGNLDYNSLDSNQKANISKLEVQAGLPVGFTSSLKLDPGANVLFTTSNDGITQVGVRNSDGSISVEKYGTKISSGSSDKMSDAEYKRAASQEMSSFLNGQANSYGHVDGGTYIYARKQWVSAGGNAQEFDDKYRDYRDPYSLDQYQLEEEIF